jgi:hypothetical protein
MATYKEIKGTQIEVLASDPSNPVEGQVWYNSTSNVLKGQAATAAGAWATGNDLNTGRFYVAGTGTQTSSLAAGGERNPGGIQTNVELYDGTSWTETTDLNTGRWGGAALGADNTAAIFAGGVGPNTNALVEQWNGSNWTEVNDMSTARS